jgi:hypothetical protein
MVRGFWENFAVGDCFSHHYDFGTTTETAITVLGIIKREPQKAVVRLLARNAPLVFKCRECGHTADYIDTQLKYESDNPFYCEKCAEKADEEMLLPITNSLRMGEYAYSGEDDTFAFNPASFAFSRKRAGLD